MKKKFKVLKYGNFFVDYSKLSEGIYGIEIPHLYSENISKSDIIKFEKGKYEFLRWSSFDKEYEEKHLIRIENLSKCKLVEVELTEL